MFLDGKSVGVVNKGGSLRLPGLLPGVAYRQGRQDGLRAGRSARRDGLPRPGSDGLDQDLIPRRRTKAAVDAFDDGMDEYNKGSAEHYKKAAVHFQKALDRGSEVQPGGAVSRRTYNPLFEKDKAKQYFQKAIEIDPDYLEARSTYGGMLLDIGDLDESIRQLNAVVRRDSKNSLAWGLLAQALCRKDSFAESIDAARKAIKLNPSNAEVHLWLAESLRRSNSSRSRFRNTTHT